LGRHYKVVWADPPLDADIDCPARHTRRTVHLRRVDLEPAPDTFSQANGAAVAQMIRAGDWVDGVRLLVCPECGRDYIGAEAGHEPGDDTG
jgi:hypothetical protein